MNHTVTDVANHHFLDRDQFVKFCEDQGERHGVFKGGFGLMVSNWHVDSLVKSARDAGVKTTFLDHDDSERFTNDDDRE